MIFKKLFQLTVQLVPASNLHYQILNKNKYPCRKNIFPFDNKTAEIFVLYVQSLQELRTFYIY